MEKAHTTSFLKYAPTKMMPLSPILTPTVKTSYDTVSLVETLMTLGVSLPTSPCTAAKRSSVSVQWQGNWGRGAPSWGTQYCPTSNPGARHRGNGLGNTIPVPTGVHTNSLARDIRCWAIHEQCPACASGIVFNQQLVHITHHTTYPMRAKQPCRGYFLHWLIFNHLQNSCTSYRSRQKQRNSQAMAHTFLVSYSVWEESQSKMQREMRALETSEQLFTWAKWRGRERRRIRFKEIKRVWIPKAVLEVRVQMVWDIKNIKLI